MARKLHPYEGFNSMSNVGLALVLGGEISTTHLKHAFELAKKEHPVLRMVIESRDDGSKAFVEKPDIEMQLMCKPDGAGESFAWQDKLQSLANTPKDHNASPTYFEWYPDCMDGGRHVLLVVMNHGGMDARGIFHVFHAFCGYLGSVLSGNDPPEPESREFVDIVGRAGVPDFPKPEVPEGIMPQLEAQKLTSEPEEKPAIRAVFKHMTETLTNGLITNSRAKGFTIQGAVTASCMLAMAKVQEEKHPLPQKISFVSPVDMRKKVDPPVGESDCVCGSSGVWWWQEIQPSHTLAEIAVCATKSLHERYDQNFGIGFWHWLQTEGWIPPYTSMGSSVGINPIQSSYGDLEVHNVDMMGASYGAVAIDKAAFMTHVHTFAGQLHLTKAYTWPGVSSETGRLVAEAEWSCLHALALENADRVTVGEFLKQIS